MRTGKQSKTVLPLAIVAITVFAGLASAGLLVYEPFAYPDGWLTGKGGAMGTSGTWTAYQTSLVIAGVQNVTDWRIHQEGNPSGIVVSPGNRNMWAGTVANLPTKGGYVGLPGPTHIGVDPELDVEIGRWQDASIALAPSVTATFKSGTTTWFSYVAVRAWDRNMEPPHVSIATDSSPHDSRNSLYNLTNSGNGIGAGGGPPSNDRFNIMPRYHSGGANYNLMGAATAWNDNTKAAAAEAKMSWPVLPDAEGFGTPSIIVGKIEWDADTNGEDILTVVRFLETDELTEEAFDALVAAQPLLSSRNWAANKPDLDQSQFKLLNIQGTKFFVDEIRIATRFAEVTRLGVSDPSPADKASVPAGQVVLSWTNMDPNDPAGPVYVDVWFGTDVNDLSPNYDFAKIVAASENTNSVTVSAPVTGTYYWQVDSYLYGDPAIVRYSNSDPNAFPIFEGSIFRFHTTLDAPPSADAGIDMITWSREPVPLDATITDDGVSAVIIAWSADAADGINVEFDPAGADIEDPTVTITKVPLHLVPIANAGFEAPLLADGGWVNTNSAPPWSTQWTPAGTSNWQNDASPNGGAWNPSIADTGYEAPEGQNAGFITTDGVSDHSLYQQLTETVRPNTTYTLSVLVGNPSVKNKGLTTDYRIELSAGGVVLTSDAGPSPVDAAASWAEPAGCSYTSGPDAASDPAVGQPLQIRLIALAKDGGYEVDFDDVKLAVDPPLPPAAGVVSVKLTLAVHDAFNPTPVTDTMVIDVYEDPCTAALGAGLAMIDPADFDGNCIVDLRDLALMAENWLLDNSLTEPVAK